MSISFVETQTFPVSPPAAKSATLHQRNSWRVWTVLWRTGQLCAARHGQRKSLGGLVGEPHLLADIGLTRGQALREAKKSFWQQ